MALSLKHSNSLVWPLEAVLNWYDSWFLRQDTFSSLHSREENMSELRVKSNRRRKWLIIIFLYLSLFSYWWTEHKTWCGTCHQSLPQSAGWGCPRPLASGTPPAPRWTAPCHCRHCCSRSGVVSPQGLLHSDAGIHLLVSSPGSLLLT